MNRAKTKIGDRLPGQSHGLWRKLVNPTAWGIVLLVVIIVGGWRVLALASRPAHLTEMADELGLIGSFLGTPEVTADGASVSFFRATETGAGLFVYDMASGKRRLLYEDPGTGNPPVQYGWSPDGKLLAISSTKDDQKMVLICNGESGQIETTVYTSITAFTWLSPSSFVYLKGGAMQERMRQVGLMRVDKDPSTGWGQPYLFTTEERMSEEEESERQYTPIRGIMATSPDSIAWLGQNVIWEWKFQESTPVKLWEGTPDNQILECRYSLENGKFLMRLRDGNGVYLADYSPGSQQPVSLGRIDNANAANLLWINHGKGYAYLLNESGSNCIYLKLDCADARPVRCIPTIGVRKIVASGNCLYATGRLERDPRGIVEYDASSGPARYVEMNPVSRYAQNVMPSSGILTNSVGSVHAYKVWLPVNFDRRKKYPLVLTQWEHGAVAIANGGLYYVCVDRPDWKNPQMSEWLQDVMAAYQLMSRNPNIDTNHVYLCGTSEETGYASQLLNDAPALWQGAILDSPVAFPDLSRTRVSKILINYGEADDPQIIKDVKKFQEDAARAGISVTVAFHHSGHWDVSSSATKDITREMVQFLVE